jgi:translation initiation factor eIF-2B subunit delta
MTYLNPQIGHLVAARPLAVSMGNAIRHLKVEISVLDIDLPEQNVNTLHDFIDLLCLLGLTPRVG